MRHREAGGVFDALIQAERAARQRRSVMVLTRYGERKIDALAFTAARNAADLMHAALTDLARQGCAPEAWAPDREGIVLEALGLLS